MSADRSSRLSQSANLLLRGLERGDQQALARQAEEVHAAAGTTLLHAGEPIEGLFFPLSGVVSLHSAVGRMEPVEIGVAGREGLVGWPALLGAPRSPHSAVVRMGSGTFLRIGSAPLRRGFEESASLRAALLQFVHVANVQMSCAIATHLEHSLGQRIARWVLMRHDRVGGDVLLTLHDEIADSLNVRRASVTDQMHLLEGRQFVRCTRGRIIVLDRPGLEAFAAGAYGAAEEVYRSLIAPFGKSSDGDTAGSISAQITGQPAGAGTAEHAGYSLA